MTIDGVLAALPYYGGCLGFPPVEAADRARQILDGVGGDPRFAMFEHKLPQSIARIGDAARPYVRVRRPFVDYRLFEVLQRVPMAARADHRWHEQWLRGSYPELFARIPNQRTAAPAGAGAARRHLTRIARFGWRTLLGAIESSGVPVRVPQRSFHPDERYWSVPSVRATLENTIMRKHSISVDLFGRPAVETTLNEFFQLRQGPVQVVGALFVYEQYHQSLHEALGAARQRARAQRSVC
jgi:hypothetical protein